MSTAAADTTPGAGHLVDEARHAGIVLWLQERNLRYRCEQTADCDRLLEALRIRKAEVVAHLEAECDADGASDVGAPLSFAQERLWLLCQLGSTGEAYHNASGVRIDGPLSYQALARSVERLITRHESLRTHFALQAGRPVQIVDRARFEPLATCDLQGLRIAEAETVLRQVIDQHAARPFDLEAGHLMRILLVRRRMDEHVLLVTIHHIVSDASSLGVLVRDLIAFYVSEITGQPPGLPSLPIRYRDFACWQRRARVVGDDNNPLAYWRQKLLGVPTVLQFPSARPRSAVADYVGADVPFVLSRQTSQALKRIAEREGATQFVSTLALLKILLHKLSGQSDFIVGTLTSGRIWPELDEVIGMFVNTLPLRGSIDGSMSFLDVLTRVRDSSLEAFAHQEAPFQSIVQAMDLGRDLSRQPLVQVLFMFRNIVAPVAPALPGLAMRTLVPRSRSAQFDLMLNVNEEEGALHCQLIYATQLFDRPAMLRLVETFVSLATQVVQQPQARVADLTISCNSLEHARYWKRTLADAPTFLELPLDHQRPNQQSLRARSTTLSLGCALTQAVRNLACAAGTSLFTVLYAGFAVLLSRLSGKNDLVIGAGFDDVLPVRTHVDQGSSILRWLRHTQTLIDAAKDNASVPFDQIVEWVGAPRSSAYAPLVQALFAFETECRNQAAVHFDLTLSFVESADDILGAFTYAADLFEPETLARWSTHLRTLLGEMTIDSEKCVRQLHLLTDEERHHLLYSLNATRSALPRAKRVHELFEEQVARTPNAVAVVHGDRQLTYLQLNARANQLARHLRARGVRAGQRIVVCMDRSLEMVCALLGSLKAGAAYVPLDPAYPAERLAWSLSDSAPSILLTRSQIHASLPETAIPVVLLDNTSEFERELTDNLESDNLSDLAYVIYTSGSTGRPKGVVIEHAGLTNYLWWALRAYGQGDSDGAPVSSSLAFDATITSLFVPLLCGRRILLLSDGEETQGLAQLLLKGRFGPVKITPAHLRVLGQQRIDSGARDEPHTFVVGGEALPPATVAMWRSLCPDAKLFNEYGPTETVVGCCIYDAAAAPADARSIPIGRPIWNTQVYILDSRYEPVPIGVTGELFIAGLGVARGYLNNPDLTAEHFVPNPFSVQPGARMYRSGDLARWRPDGNMEFLGRTDDQVKIRGFRIEPGEIEARLQLHAQIKECVVISRESGGADRELVAYFTSLARGGPDAEELREHLQRHLPEHMVPWKFVQLDGLPVTAHGKIDRQRLPAPVVSSSDPNEDCAPRGDVERALARIWTELLRIPNVGRHDNFFALGGHSLLSALCTTRLKAELGLELPIAAFFHGATIAQLAAATTGPPQAGRVMHASTEQGPALFLFHPIGGHGLQYRDLAQYLSGFARIHLIQRPELQSGTRVRFYTLAELCTSYVEQILSLEPEGPYCLSGWSLGARLALHVAAQLEALGKAVTYLGLIDGSVALERPINFDRDLLHIAGRDVAEEMRRWDPARLEPVRHAWEQNPAAALIEREQGHEVERYFQIFVANAWLGCVSEPLTQRIRTRSVHVYCASATLASADSLSALEDTLRAVCAVTPSLAQFPGNHYEIVAGPGVKSLAARISQDAYAAADRADFV
jgi:amino acid adenylation domain-containing protein